MVACCWTTFMSGDSFFISRTYEPLFTVALVAMTPTVPPDARVQAARAPASMTPMTGSGYSFFSVSSAAAEEVLQATTTILTSRDTR